MKITADPINHCFNRGIDELDHNHEQPTADQQSALDARSP